MLSTQPLYQENCPFIFQTDVNFFFSFSREHELKYLQKRLQHEISISANSFPAAVITSNKGKGYVHADLLPSSILLFADKDHRRFLDVSVLDCCTFQCPSTWVKNNSNINHLPLRPNQTNVITSEFQALIRNQSSLEDGSRHTSGVFLASPSLSPAASRTEQLCRKDSGIYLFTNPPLCFPKCV